MTTNTLVHSIEASIFQKSKELAEDLLNRSEVLRENYNIETMVDNLYSERRALVKNIVGDTGRFEFTPKSAYDAKEEADKLISVELEQLEKAFNLTPLNSKEGEEIKVRYRVLQLVRGQVSNLDYLNNVVPKSIIDYSASYTENGKPFLTSPKLSRWITKLVGESSELTKWYTNRCPKGTDVLGERDDYRLILSTLPHDIMGMSYYAPLNWGGERWLDGYNGTSCMDTIRNGDGGSMNQLPLNLADETLMVAFLVKKDEEKPYRFDELEEVMNARMLVRVAEINGKRLLIGQRIYATTRSEFKLIDEAMKVEFGRDYVHCDELDRFGGESKRYIYYFEKKQEEDFNTRNCPSCDGEGYDYDGDECGSCGGSGYTDSYELPYNDNPNQLDFGYGHVKFRLPKQFVEAL